MVSPHARTDIVHGFYFHHRPSTLSPNNFKYHNHIVVLCTHTHIYYTLRLHYKLSLCAFFFFFFCFRLPLFFIAPIVDCTHSNAGGRVWGVGWKSDFGKPGSLWDIYTRSCHNVSNLWFRIPGRTLNSRAHYIPIRHQRKSPISFLFLQSTTATCLQPPPPSPLPTDIHTCI